MPSENILPLIILILYMAMTVGIGLYAHRQTEDSSTKSFLTGGGGVGFWVNGFAIFAAFATGGTMLGNIGLSYSGGWGYITAYNGGVALGYLITTFFLAKILRNMNVATVPELIKARYNHRLMNLTVPIVLIGTLTAYIVAQMKIGGLIGEQIFGIPYSWSVILIGAVYVFYTFAGGMKAVTLTDFLQGMMMIGVVLATGFIAVNSNGGFSVYEVAQGLRPQWTLAEVYPPISYIGAFLIWATCNAILPHTVMRIFAAKDQRTGRASLALGLGLYVITGIVTCVFVIAGTIVLTGGEDIKQSDGAFLLFLDQATPNWVRGLAFAGIFAAVMSSVSAMLLALSAALSYDLIAQVRPSTSDETKRKVTRFGILGFGIVTLILSLNPPEFLTLLYSAAMGLLASSLFFPTLLGLWWRRISGSAAFVGASVGGISYLILLFGFDLPALSQICYSMPLSGIACVVCAYIFKPATPQQIRRLTIAHQREVTDDEAEEFNRIAELELRGEAPAAPIPPIHASNKPNNQSETKAADVSYKD
ncbi:sodium:solute symporter family protein [Corynebacterium sp. 153RC1]|uniref:sodium:solute symporter family protein n=1 Tax=unclassified Corynebacterium TaxID=2624378 RepID=UPI00211C6597|nr:MULTISPECIES: sodium:solute symporter family protein [unclassified Corynebacterium]MCQ9353429.1 sodium:solute symporter family protein [Corynebacterium sp. 209RC1]MCQ9355651.1 sodium:solute symporter family protein [Corynebacterium sp. 1222RC1]MCQ9357844.1 sodium:solute symporter family protein [Corynebacterium sp. 122RC1]MCQ9360028.1 sodium:solute symporter family protein [Corynebacterium sp. 142RC1]MCQ9362172.1 sodium:solute symporter family protein [Corynebacterium sp. 153RC1]